MKHLNDEEMQRRRDKWLSSLGKDLFYKQGVKQELLKEYQERVLNKRFYEENKND